MIEREQTWKEWNLYYFKKRFGDKVAEYMNYHDDRRLYANVYNIVMEAINSLPDEPLVFIKVAMDRRITEEAETLKEIRERFDRFERTGSFDEEAV